MMFFANRDAIRVNPRFGEMIIPVEWREEHKSKLKTRETLQITNRAIAEGKAAILFPSGRIAYWADGRLNERPWKLIGRVAGAQIRSADPAGAHERAATPACSTGWQNGRRNCAT